MIENMNRFIADDDAEDDEDSRPNSREGRRRSKGGNDEESSLGGGKKKKKDNKAKKTIKGKRVNFSKASCTLDASVKIYSYRVDYVHLTSYKVLANLNRTDNRKTRGTDDGEGGESETKKSSSSAVGGRKQSERRGVVETLESNIANLNMTKHDYAYDIDPLFHQMSKNFDEGAAKGLLLNNLGVASDSCAIVFDSAQDNDAAEKPTSSLSVAVTEEVADETKTREGKDEDVDITDLCDRLTMLDGADLATIPLVPQLQGLREEYGRLEAEGFSGERWGRSKL